MDSARIYVVEDEQNIRELLLYALSANGFDARGFEAAGPFYAALAEAPPALVVLDIMLPGEDGFAILRRLRKDEKTARLPVMMLTARDSEYDKVAGLDAGADDYLTKPFGVMELVARVKALLRRANTGADGRAPAEISAGGITLVPQKRAVLAGGKSIALTAKEFDLLALLLAAPGVVFSRDFIMDSIWGYNYAGETRTVDVHIRSLRAKLGAAGGGIETVRGVGYRFGERK